MAITAKQVKELREMTGAGMMDCKKALTSTDGDMDKAVEFLREKGLAFFCAVARHVMSSHDFDFGCDFQSHATGISAFMPPNPRFPLENKD